MDGIRQFEELLKTDRDFQKKLQEAAQAYTGEQTEEAIFNQVLVPVAAEYGITATFEEYRKYMDSLSGSEMSALSSVSDTAASIVPEQGKSLMKTLGRNVCKRRKRINNRNLYQ